MGFFDSVMEGLFGSDDMSDEIGELIDFGKGQAEQISGMATGGFNVANLLMPALLSELGISVTTDKSGNITGFNKEESRADKLRGNLEITTLKALKNFYAGKGPLPEGLKSRNRLARQNLRSQLGKSGFSRGDSPFEEAMSRLREDVAIQNDAFRHGQFANAANLMNAIDVNQRGDLGTFLTGAISAQQSPIPWLNTMVANTGSLAGLAGGAGQVQGSPGLLGTALGSWAGSQAGSDAIAGAIAGMFCWVARAVYGDDNPDWLRFRFWLVSRAPLWFGAAYRRHGRRVAGWIHRFPVIGTLLRPLMDRVI